MRFRVRILLRYGDPDAGAISPTLQLNFLSSQHPAGAVPTLAVKECVATMARVRQKRVNAASPVEPVTAACTAFCSMAKRPAAKI